MGYSPGVAELGVIERLTLLPQRDLVFLETDCD